MGRALRWLKWIVATAVLAPLLLVACLLVVLNIAPGQRVAANLVNQFAGSVAQVHGISGSFPRALRIASIDLRDGAGTYAIIRGAALDWSPWQLLRRDASIQSLTAEEVEVLRLPASSASTGASAPGGGFSLPLHVDLDRLHIGALALARPVLGVPALMRVTGSAHLASLEAGRATIDVQRLDRPGTYHLAGRIDPASLAGALSAEEPAQGFVAQVAELPGLGALALHASVDGKWTGAATTLSLAAGPLRADAHGTVDINGEAADLDLAATAPAMSPRPGISWQSVAVEAHVHGKLGAPQASGTVRIADLAAAGAKIDRLSADVTGDTVQAQLAATAQGVTVPGPKPDLLAAGPVELRARVDLARPDRPATFAVSHPLLRLDGTATTAGTIRAQAHLDLPDLGALAAAAGQDVQGHAALDLTATEGVGGESGTVKGTLGITGGKAPLPALIGPAATLDLAAALHGQDITISRLALNGKALSFAAHGGETDQRVTLDWQAALADLSAVAPTVQGRLDGHGRVTGPLHDLAATATLTGEVATQGVPKGPLTVTLAANGLPGSPAGKVTAQGSLDGAPLALDVAATRAADGTLRVEVTRAAWKSAGAHGAFSLPPGAALPLGNFSLRMARLADLSRLTGESLQGSIAAEASLADAGGVPTATLTLDATNAGLGGTASVRTAKLTATVRNPATAPNVTAALDVTDFAAGKLGGSVRVAAQGPQSSLGLKLAADVTGLAGSPLAARGSATVDVPKKSVTLTALSADWKGETLRLLGPARISDGNGLAVDRLRLGVQQAVLELSGRVSPTLDLTASLRDLRPEVARAVMPNLRATGEVNAEAHLTGTAARPTGTIRLTARDLHATTGDAAALPAASLTADAKLAGTTADVDVRFAAGANRLALTGTAPIAAAAPMRLHATGGLDLATANPILSANGQHVLGHVALDATITGTAAAPRASGALRLTGGAAQDYANGAHVSGISALVQAEGDHVRLVRLDGRAGNGTLSARGTLGLGGAMPVDLTFTAHDAQPFVTDEIKATLNADLSLRGDAAGQLAARGTVTIDNAEIRIPEKLPSSIAVLDVRRPGQAPAPPPTPGPDIALDVTVSAPGQVFIRGRGLFAEVAGKVKVGGTAAKPIPVGAFRLVRGEFNLAGTTLTFTKGTVSFLGGGKLDPALNLVATSTNSNITATLTVGGFASAPKITLSSQPPLPQDEVLAQLLFGQSAGSLTAGQLASAAAAVAQISGMGGGAFSPLDSLRQSLGLDRLAVGGGTNGSGPSVQAGSYVARGVYVGAKQATNGQGTQGTVQVDLAKGLKLETTVGTGGQTQATGAQATQDPYATSVGLTYTFSY